MQFIFLSMGKFATVDDDDHAELKGFIWCASKSAHAFYAKRRKGRSFVYMHREIMNCPDGQEVHHRNGDTLDNRRENLFICSRSVNLAYRDCGNGG